MIKFLVAIRTVGMTLKMNHTALFAIGLVLLQLPRVCLSQEIEAGYGPFDYTNPDHFHNKLPVVEIYHFDRNVENLVETFMSGGTIGDNLWYVIRSFPNHHRGLVSFARYWREYTAVGAVPPGLSYDRSPEIVFKRAMDFAPHDGVVRLIYGMHLFELGELEAAEDLFEEAHALGEDQPELQYNLGLMYMKLGNSEQALVHAETAYAAGYPLEGLRNLLIRDGAWPASEGG